MVHANVDRILTLLAASSLLLFLTTQLSSVADTVRRVPQSAESMATPARKGTVRKAFLMSVNPGQEAEYERRHRPIWPELEATLKDHGVVTYSIFLHAETRQLFAYVEFENEEQWNAVAQTEVCRRWWAYMKEIMPCHPDNSPVSKEIKEVFHLER